MVEMTVYLPELDLNQIITGYDVNLIMCSTVPSTYKNANITHLLTTRYTHVRTFNCI